MPYMLEDLVVDRVDLVDEGANSAAFIEIFKRKERENMDINEIISKMKPEHAEVIQKALDDSVQATSELTEQLEKSKEEVSTLTEQLEKSAEQITELTEAVETAKAAAACDPVEEKSEEDLEKEAGNGASFDEDEVVKGLPEAARELLMKERAKREAAEEQVRKAAEKEAHEAAVAKAASFKSLPLAQDKLVELVKAADPAVLDVLETVNAAIENTVLTEVGKGHSGEAPADTWSKIESEASKLMEADTSLSKQRAIAQVIKTKPELYKEYLDEQEQGGVN